MPTENTFVYTHLMVDDGRTSAKVKSDTDSNRFFCIAKYKREPAEININKILVLYGPVAVVIKHIPKFRLKKPFAIVLHAENDLAHSIETVKRWFPFVINYYN